MIKKIIAWALYIPSLWLFIEGSSFIATYVVYSTIDKENPTEINARKLPKLRPFLKHPLFALDYASENVISNVYDAFLSHRFAPNSEYQRLEVNSYGFIHNGDAKRPPFANNKAIKVVLLGGSSMAGHGVLDNRCTIASFLERKLNSNDLNIKYEVLNAGQGSYYSPIELTYFVIELVNYRPDFVVALDGWNDFWHSLPTNNLAAIYEDWAIPQRSGYQRRIEEFVNNVSIGSILGTVQNDKRFRRVFWFTVDLIAGKHIKSIVEPSQNGESIWGENSIYVRDKINKTYSHVPFFEKNWRSLIGAARANNIKPILLLQPELYVSGKKLTNAEADRYIRSFRDEKLPREVYEKKITAFYKEAKQMVKRLKISFPNSEDAIIEDISKMFIGESETMFFDLIHYTHLGNRKIAELIASKISNNSSEFIDSVCD